MDRIRIKGKTYFSWNISRILFYFVSNGKENWPRMMHWPLDWSIIKVHSIVLLNKQFRFGIFILLVRFILYENLICPLLDWIGNDQSHFLIGSIVLIPMKFFFSFNAIRFRIGTIFLFCHPVHVHWSSIVHRYSFNCSMINKKTILYTGEERTNNRWWMFRFQAKENGKNNVQELITKIENVLSCFFLENFCFHSIKNWSSIVLFALFSF